MQLINCFNADKGLSAAPDANKRDKQLLREHFEELEGESDEDDGEDEEDGDQTSADEGSDEGVLQVRSMR